MIRILLSAFNIVGMAHLVLIIGIVGWLIATHRLNLDRIRQIQDLLMPTVEEAAALVESEAQAAVEEAEQLEIAKIEGDPPPSSADHISYAARVRQADFDQARRLQQETNDLRQQLLDSQAALAAERTAFETERETWTAERDRTLGTGTDAQFQRVVRVLEQIPARQAKEFIVSLIQSGAVEDAVIYFNAMKPFNASEVIKQFKEDEQAMATDLLQRLKSLGESSDAGPLSDADTAADSG